MNRLVLLFAVFVEILMVQGLRPVKDFRVKDMVGGKVGSEKEGSKNIVINIGNSEGASSTYAASTTSAVSGSYPTIELSDDVQFVYTDDSNSIYYMNVEIPSGGKDDDVTYPLVLDTGSSITWIYNSSCSGDACESDSVEKFDDSAKIKTEDTFKLSYSGDIVSGSLFSLASNGLKFSLGGLELKNMTIGLASNSPEIFDGYNVSGLLGAPNTQNDEKNFMSQIVSEDLADKNVFSLLLTTRLSVKYVDSKGDDKDIPTQYGGLVFFGSKGPKNIANDIHYTDVIENDNNYWLINITNINLVNDSNTEVLNSTTNHREAIVDTGTTGIVLPLSDADALHKKMFGSDYISDKKGNYAFLCDNNDTEVELEINDTKYNVTTKDIKGNEYSSSGLNGYCASKIQGSGEGSSWVLGTTFLNKYLTVFDPENGQIGFGVLNFADYMVKEKKENDSTSSQNASSASSESETSSSHHTSSKVHSNATKSGSKKADSGAHNMAPTITLMYTLMSLLICITFI